jgi:hypothetical protein
VSGLARSHIMRQPALDEQAVRRLLNNQEPLRKRVIAIPKAIVAESISLDTNKPPFSELFGKSRATETLLYTASQARWHPSVATQNKRCFTMCHSSSLSIL